MHRQQDMLLAEAPGLPFDQAFNINCALVVVTKAMGESVVQLIQ